MCIYTMSIHSVYLVSDLEGSDNGDPLMGLFIVLVVSHGLVTVLGRLLKMFLRVGENKTSGP